MENKGPYYITTAIAYATGKPHIGNVYEIVLADAIARYKRMTGYEVHFQTGTDEHGQKVGKRAAEAGLMPKEFADRITREIKEQFDCVNVSYDHFVHTTDPDHELTVQKIFRKLYEQGDIYKGHYDGLYCPEDEAFCTASQVTADGKCPVCGGELIPMQEETYFFRASKYADRLMRYIEEHPEFIQPDSRRNEMINNFLKPGLQDLSVSRTSFKWGIPVDFDPQHVIYVWIDALSNYITGLGYDVDGNSAPLFERFWPADLHLVGKDIIRFHTIYWPIMLMALGLPLPKQVFGHPWLLTGNDKMSKSHGNVIYTKDMVKLFGTDAVRYIMLHEMPFDQDGHITYALMIDRINSALANNLGNLVNRTLAMQNKYFNGMVANPQEKEEIDDALVQKATETVREVDEQMRTLHVAEALSAIFGLLDRANKYIDETMPWTLAKDSDRISRLATVLYNLLESIRFAAVLLSAFLPETAHKILDQLHTEQRDYDSLSSFGRLETGVRVAEHPQILFARLDEKEIMAQVEDMQKKQAEEIRLAKTKAREITMDDFGKLDLVVGKVVSCRKHPDAEKLLIETVDIGGGEIRQIVSGIADSYTPGQMIGKLVVVVSNLKATVIRGEESCGMLLAGKSGGAIAVVEVNGLEPGTKIS